MIGEQTKRIKETNSVTKTEWIRHFFEDNWFHQYSYFAIITISSCWLKANELVI